MPLDFARAAFRHLRDASLLRQNERLANADHLAGLAAECAIKVALPKDVAGDVEIRHRWHVNDLWYRVLPQRFQRSHANLAVLVDQHCGAFDDWSADSATMTEPRLPKR
jgi:hypothetical protein